MSVYTQEDRRLTVETPLGADVLLLTAFNGREELSRPFSYQLDMLSESTSIAAKDIVGKRVTFSIGMPDGSPRYFNGFVARFSYLGRDDRISRYSAEVVPWLWFLSRTADCRIFQNKSVPEIIEQIFTDLGFSDFEKSGIQGSHPKWDYCVQYRETDLNFVSRLMEQEGIFYFFRHESGKHTLVMADSKRAYKDCEENEVSFAETLSTQDPTDQLTGWEHRYEFRPGKWAQTDYNFETPSTSLMTQTNTVVKLDGNTKYEIYDYPGEYEKKADGEAEVKVRMEEDEVPHDVVLGASRCRTFTPGGRFKVVKHHGPAEEGKSYVITAIRHTATQPGSYISGGEIQRIDYGNQFECVPDSITFRPARLTPKPFVRGAQTAVVVGPGGEEIYTDKYGRVKVQFFWDREGKKDDKSSCWIRVSQVCAGKQWGAIDIPRIGQEVIVDFLEGDPDRPIITGRVYNDEQMPPYGLPDGKTVSGMKSNSHKAKGYNEFVLDDTGGKEMIRTHAQYDMETTVKHNRTDKIDVDDSETVGGNQSLTVKGNRREMVEKAEKVHVKGTRDVQIDSEHKEKIGSSSHIHVTGDHLEKIDGQMSLQVGAARHEKIATVYTVEAGQEVHLKGGGKVIIEAGMQLSLVGPGGFVDIGPAGVTIQGTMVKINSGGVAGKGTDAAPTAPTDPKAD